jgi:hypothetical protein
MKHLKERFGQEVIIGEEFLLFWSKQKTILLTTWINLLQIFHIPPVSGLRSEKKQ